MPSSVDKTPVPRLAGSRPRNARPVVVPAIPLPLVKNRQQQKRQKEPVSHHGNDEAAVQYQGLESKSESFPASIAQPSVPETVSSEPVPSLLSSPDVPRTSQIASALVSPRLPSSTIPRAAHPNSEVSNQPPVHNGTPTPYLSDTPGFVNQRGAHNGDASYPTGFPMRSEIQHQQSALHQVHLGNGTITFGSLHNSENASPSPNHSHKGLPPPGLGVPSLPYGPYNPPRPGLGEWPGPPRMAPLGDPNGYTPAQSLNSPTPASFQSSQSPDNVSGGSGAHGSHGPGSGPFPIPDVAPLPSPYGFPGGGLAHTNDDMHARDGSHHIGFELTHFLQQRLHHSFYEPRSADCYLVLHFPQIQSQAAGIPDNTVVENVDTANPTISRGVSSLFMGHRAVLTQSYTLSQALQNGGSMQTGTFGYPVLVVHISLDDPYVSVEGSTQALRSLYGISINDVTVGTTRSRPQAMDAALANLAAGFLFMSDYVEMAGVEQASRLLGWDTVEKVLAFCLNGVCLPNMSEVDHDIFGLPYPQAVFRYAREPGQALRQLLQRALDFIVWNFPADFVIRQDCAFIDASPISVSRFPPGQNLRNSMGEMESPVVKDYSTEKRSAHANTNLSTGSVSLPSRIPDVRSKRTQQPSKIVFGDFSPTPSNEPSTATMPTTVNGENKWNDVQVSEVNSTTEVALSRILLGLHFGFLNYVFEHPNLGRGGSTLLRPLSFDARKEVVRHVVVERERHRRKVLHEVQATNQGDILARIYKPSPPLHQDYPVDGWDVLGWKETCHDEASGLVRVWALSESSG